jgi:hypothetical protein
MNLQDFPGNTGERYQSHAYHTMNRTTWLWEGEWEKVNKNMLMGSEFSLSQRMCN